MFWVQVAVNELQDMHTAMCLAPFRVRDYMSVVG